MSDPNIHEVLTTLRDVRLELEALKRMFFEHRPQFIQSFAQQRAAVEASGHLEKLDCAIRGLEPRLVNKA
jgi:hypothetical protein